METTWTPQRTADLETYWVQGLTTAEIGLRLGISKNAIIGKAHRIHLPPRPSPIKRSPRPAPVLKGPECQWVEGTPGEIGFRYCGEEALALKPYCAEHYVRAYVGVKLPAVENAA